uniref:Ubiquitin carboxyl-terminal hydrolase n=1 Tax=Steinernema glaseri TaxID=37863 RepID=A0A1I7Y7I8_9BILA
MPVVYYPPPTPPWYSSGPGRMTLLLGGALASAALYFYATTKDPQKHREGKEGLYTVPGLQNTGNSCFANSLLQALASSSAFIDWLNQLDYSNPKGMQFLAALRETLNGLNYSERPTASAAGVIESLTCYGWNIGMGRQQDLYELFNVFVSTWDDELKGLRRSLRYSLSSVGDEPSNPAEEGQEDEEDPPAADQSCCLVRSKDFEFLKAAFVHCQEDLKAAASLRPPCTGVLATTLQCCQVDCLRKKVRYDDFCGLSLSIPRSFSHIQVTLDALLRKYFSVESIPDASCDFCKSRFKRSNSGLMKKQGFCKLPTSLVLRIERIEYTSGGGTYKRPDHVKFPEYLDVRDYCFYHSKEGEYARAQAHKHLSNGSLPRPPGGSSFKPPDVLKEAGILLDRISDTLRSRNFKYELRAVSEHLGGADSGHFITYRKALKSKTWYRTSDSHVSQVPYSSVEASNAYLLIYDKVVPQAPAEKAVTEIALD